MSNDSVDPNKYIVFQVGKYRLAIPLMSAREVVEKHEVSPVAKSKKYFNGVTNIRGEVIGVIDLREKLNIPSEDYKTDKDVMILFDFEEHTLAAIVDCLVRVDQVEEADIDAGRGMKNGLIEDDYLVGIYHKDDELIKVVNIKDFLNFHPYLEHVH